MSIDHRFTLQYAFWDFLRSLGEGQWGKEGKTRGQNIAKTIAYVIGRGSLDLTMLKVGEIIRQNITN
jgi:nucleolar MIF4G domain-containing protein 1